MTNIKVHACDHDHEGDHDHDGEPASTGFLPISLALALFITGLFVLDVFDLGCSAPPASASSSP